MKKDVLFPELIGEMAKHGETTKTLSELLGVSRVTLYNKFSGKSEWNIREVDIICNHYKKDYYELFRKNK